MSPNKETPENGDYSFASLKAKFNAMGTLGKSLAAAAGTVVAYQLYFQCAYRPRSMKGQVVLITGGGSGIGRRFADKYAKLGATIVLWDLNPNGLAAAQKALTETSTTTPVHTQVVDVSSAEAVREAAAQTIRSVGAVDTVFNNAGIVTGKPLLECPDALIQKTMDVNTTAHFWTIKAFLPGMLERNRGQFVTIASMAGVTGVPALSDYCASKSGAIGTHDSLYLELRKQGRHKDIFTTLVCPYYINTGMFDGVRGYPWLPILDEGAVVNRIVRGALRGEHVIIIPSWLSYLVPIGKVLPPPVTAMVMDLMGVTKTMDNFKGRK